jgi:hypothetical protein
MARENTAQSNEYDENDQANVRPGPVTRDFETKKSLGAKATNFGRERESANDAEYLQKSVDDALYAEELKAIALEEVQEATRRSIFRRQRVIQKQQQLKGALTKARGAVGMARLGTLTGAGIAWFFQMLAGAASLVAFGGQGSVDYFLKETLVGKIFNATIGYFIDLHSVIPFDSLAIAFWGIATLIAVGTFIVYLLFFFFTAPLTGVKPFDSSMDYLMAAVTFAFCILPVANLLPAVIFWVVYVNLSSIKPLVTKGDVMGGV